MSSVENKQIHDNTYNLENISVTPVGEFNENCTSKFIIDSKNNEVGNSRSSTVSEQHTKLKHGPGRPKIIRAGTPGRPKKVYAIAEKLGGRQKLKTARNAEEITGKTYLNSDRDSSDSTEQLATMNHKLEHDIRPASPPSLKRNCSENEVFNGNIKNVKMSANSGETSVITNLSFVEKFFRRDIKEELPKLTQEELEELLVQKIVETITMRGEIGQLREQARLSEKSQEVTRVKLQQLMKQVKDFEMVLARNKSDLCANPDKYVAPIKIYSRSVGVQVNFITEHGIQNLWQVRQTSNLKPTPNASSSSNSSSAETNNNAASPRRCGIITRSPRPVAAASTPVISQSPFQTAPHISTVAPAALVVAKLLDSPHTLTLSNQSACIQSILPVPQQLIQSQPHRAVVLNGKIQNQVNRSPLIVSKPRNIDLINLTDE